MAIEYTNFYHSKALENVPKFGFLVRKHTIWQPWPKYWPNLPTRPWNPGGSSKKDLSARVNPPCLFWTVVVNLGF
jgi:hypothetical protein